MYAKCGYVQCQRLVTNIHSMLKTIRKEKKRVFPSFIFSSFTFHSTHKAIHMEREKFCWHFRILSISVILRDSKMKMLQVGCCVVYGNLLYKFLIQLTLLNGTALYFICLRNKCNAIINGNEYIMRMCAHTRMCLYLFACSHWWKHHGVLWNLRWLFIWPFSNAQKQKISWRIRLWNELFEWIEKSITYVLCLLNIHINFHIVPGVVMQDEHRLFWVCSKISGQKKKKFRFHLVHSGSLRVSNTMIKKEEYIFCFMKKRKRSWKSLCVFSTLALLWCMILFYQNLWKITKLWRKSVGNSSLL